VRRKFITRPLKSGGIKPKKNQLDQRGNSFWGPIELVTKTLVSSYRSSNRFLQKKKILVEASGMAAASLFELL
jgi:hypothetical protein